MLNTQEEREVDERIDSKLQAIHEEIITIANHEAEHMRRYVGEKIDKAFQRLWVYDGNRPEDKTGAVLPDCLKGLSTKDIWNLACDHVVNDMLNTYEGKTAKHWFDETVRRCRQIDKMDRDHHNETRELKEKHENEMRSKQWHIEAMQRAVKKCTALLTPEQITEILKDEK